LHYGLKTHNKVLEGLYVLLSLGRIRLRILSTWLRPCPCLAEWLKGFCKRPAMTARDTGCDSMARCQLDICGPSVTLGEALLLPKRHQCVHLTDLAEHTDSLEEIPTPAEVLSKDWEVLSTSEPRP
jgi:hypothetical protein